MRERREGALAALRNMAYLEDVLLELLAVFGRTGESEWVGGTEPESATEILNALAERAGLPPISDEPGPVSYWRTLAEDLGYRVGYWDCSGCGAMGSAEDHLQDDEFGRCLRCQDGGPR